MDGELTGEEAACQFSTRWRELGKKGMRDDWGTAKGVCCTNLADRGLDCGEFIKIPDRMWGDKDKLVSYIPSTKSENGEEQLLHCSDFDPQ